MHQRQELPQRTVASRLIVVIRGERAEDDVPVIDTMIEAGVRSFELTLTTQGTVAALLGLAERYAATADLGIGTVACSDDVDAAVDGGAHYLVTRSPTPRSSTAPSLVASRLCPAGSPRPSCSPRGTAVSPR